MNNTFSKLIRLKALGLFLALSILSACGVRSTIDNSYDDSDYVLKDRYTEYCFNSTQQTLGIANVTSTPQQYLLDHSNVVAAINGVYYAADTDEPLGVVYYNGEQLADGRGSVRGYFLLDKEGKAIIQDDFNEDYSNQQIVIGTHPLLVLNGEVHDQSLEGRYVYLYNNGVPFAQNRHFRSAIGIKNDEVCLAHIDKYKTINDWATLLQSKGYVSALNLDGGGPSQLVIRDQEPVRAVVEDTKLIIYIEEK